LCVFLALIFWPEMIAPKKIAVGNLDVYYSGSATQSDAHGLADGLTKIGLCSHSQVSVFLAKSKNTPRFSPSFVQDGFWNRPSVRAGIRQHRPNCGSDPRRISSQSALINGKQEVEKEYWWQRRVMGPTRTFATSERLPRQRPLPLGEVFQHNQYLLNRPWDVFLTKGSGGTTISIVTTSGWMILPRSQFMKAWCETVPSGRWASCTFADVGYELGIQKEEMVR
jgi:hypothetical protein